MSTNDTYLAEATSGASGDLGSRRLFGLVESAPWGS